MLAEPVDEGIHGRRIDVRQLRAVDGAGIVIIAKRALELQQNGTGPLLLERRAHGLGVAQHLRRDIHAAEVGDSVRAGLRLVIDDLRVRDLRQRRRRARAVRILRVFLQGEVRTVAVIGDIRLKVQQQRRADDDGRRQHDAEHAQELAQHQAPAIGKAGHLSAPPGAPSGRTIHPRAPHGRSPARPQQAPRARRPPAS